MKLEHLFIYQCIDPAELLKNCFKLNTFLSRVEKQAKRFAPKKTDKQNQYKGAALECFSEYLIKTMGFDKRVGITNYQLVDEGEDTGVDGHGIGIDGNPATVQVKYRQADWVLTANDDHLTNFTNASMMRFGVSSSLDDKNMLLITTGKGLHYFTAQNMFSNRVRVLNREKLRVLVDDNKAFWLGFAESIASSLPKKKQK